MTDETVSPSALVGDIVFLRELRDEDATEAYASWLNDPVVNQYLETRSVTISELVDAEPPGVTAMTAAGRR